MTWTPWLDLRVRAAAVFALASVTVAVGTIMTAMRDTAVVPAAPLPTMPLATATAAAPAVPVEQLVALAPFSESRTGASEAPQQDAVSLPITLVGTVVGTGRPAAICRLGAGRARILHLGDTLGGLRLLQVTPGRAVFIDAAAVRHELRLSSSRN